MSVPAVKSPTRDERGRLLPGHHVGRKSAPVELSYLDAWREEMGIPKLREAIRELYRLATTSDDERVRVAALKLILDRCVPGEVKQIVEVETRAYPSGLERVPPELLLKALAEGAKIGGIDLDSCSPDTKRDFIRATATVKG